MHFTASSFQFSYGNFCLIKEYISLRLFLVKNINQFCISLYRITYYLSALTISPKNKAFCIIASYHTKPWVTTNREGEGRRWIPRFARSEINYSKPFFMELFSSKLLIVRTWGFRCTIYVHMMYKTGQRLHFDTK